jgi:GT2 family glycosyltransferase
VDLAWRAQLLGWRSRYTPAATGYHVRGFHPGKRKHMPAWVRRHALKNRWLLAVKNELRATFLRDLPHILPYEIQILGYVLLAERTSLPAFADFLRLLPRALRWRREIRRRVRIQPDQLTRWFDQPWEEPPPTRNG